jgi:putative hydrolase of the HAD superfamily
MSYRAILFDLGRVLVHFDFQRVYRKLEGMCPHAASEIPKRFAETRLAERFETGLIESRDFHAEVRQILGLNVDFDAFCALFCEIFTDILVPDGLVGELAGRYRLVLLSNTNAIHFEMVRRTYPILRHFHAFCLSYEVKAMKPNPKIYQAAVEMAGCLPEECFYTDDIAKYVEGAQRLGIDAVQFAGAEQLQQEMRARGIL